MAVSQGSVAAVVPAGVALAVVAAGVAFAVAMIVTGTSRIFDRYQFAVQ